MEPNADEYKDVFWQAKHEFYERFGWWPETLTQRHLRMLQEGDDGE